MKTPLVLIDNEKGILARFVYGEITDSLRFRPDVPLDPTDVEFFRKDPIEFKRCMAL